MEATDLLPAAVLHHAEGFGLALKITEDIEFWRFALILADICAAARQQHQRRQTYRQKTFHGCLPTSRWKKRISTSHPIVIQLRTMKAGA
ncbi:hypothetical protein D3C76_1185140 [compost metagenome]